MVALTRSNVFSDMKYTHGSIMSKESKVAKQEKKEKLLRFKEEQLLKKFYGCDLVDIHYQIHTGLFI